MAGGRLAKDVQYLCKNVEAYTDNQAKITEVDDNLICVKLDIMPNGGPYRGAKLQFKIQFDQSLYPTEAPTVLCLDNVYHPNIDPTEICGDMDEYCGSNVCVSLLDEWDSSMGLDHVVMSILFLMYHPNPEDALSPYFEGSDFDDFESNVRISLKGGEVEGVQFPRLLISDEDDDDDDCCAVKEKNNDGADAAETAVISNVFTNQNSDTAAGNEGAVAVETVPDSVNILASDDAIASGVDNADLIGSEVDPVIPKLSKLEWICNHQNLALTDFINSGLETMLTPVINDNTEMDGNGTGVKGRSRTLAYRDSLVRAPEVSILFSNFLGREGNVQISGTAAYFDSGDCDVD